MLAKSIVIFCFLQFYLPDKTAGKLNVTLAVFSGVPDPHWVVLPSNSNHKQIQQLLGAARKGGFTYSPLQMPSRLGYKGFLISELTKQISELIVGPETVKLQTVLLQTIPKAMLKGKFEAFKNRVLKEEITPGKVKAVKRPTKGKQKRYAYPYDFIPWVIPQWFNNCYNYANNKITNTFAQPGRGSGARCIWPTNACVRNAAINDGLENLETDPLPVQPVPRAPNGKRHLVALVVMPGFDYHWYRLDQDGFWSHKPGVTAVTNTDNNGNLIADPRAAAIGFYQFACFMTSNKDTVTIS